MLFATDVRWGHNDQVVSKGQMIDFAVSNWHAQLFVHIWDRPVHTAENNGTDRDLFALSRVLPDFRLKFTLHLQNSNRARV